MSLTASVVSAAISEGNLIIGSSDGSIINCGYVQGPPGLKGDPGPMGAVGNDGATATQSDLGWNATERFRR